MWIISKSRLRSFWESKQGNGSQTQLEAWHHVVSKARWETFSDVKKTYGAAADLVGDCVVFDIAGNHFRLVTRIRYKSHKVFILKLMPHKEYDAKEWKTECGCYMAPPSRKEKPKARKPRAKEMRRNYRK